MTDSRHHGVMAMVNIDGGKVKSLREQKGLTQLYVATAVQVTTDTISRWENKRYPTIKKENALRLAEALEVELEEILESQPYEQQGQNQPTPDAPSHTVTPNSLSKIWPLLILAAVIAGIVSLSAIFLMNGTEAPKVTATRSLPLRYTVNKPFPVTIEVTGVAESNVSLIIKEILPPAVMVSNTDPEIPKSGIKNQTLKWLHKVQGQTQFTYVAVIREPTAGASTFSGTIAAGNNAAEPIPILGNNTILPGPHHWADSDGDNIIDDKEILTVYDQYGDLEKLGMDVDLIEEIWLGSGYRWDKDSQSYEILP